MKSQKEDTPIYNFNQLKQALREGANIIQILNRVAYPQPKHITIDLYKKAKNDLWEETVPQKKTKIGKLIYK